MLEYVSTKRITAEDVLREGSPWRDCEIWDGIPMVCEPSGGWAQSVTMRVLLPLGNHVQAHDLGWVFPSEQGYLVARDPDRLLAPDASYVSRARLSGIPARGFLTLTPDFVVEVRSPTDQWEAVLEKCGIWIAHGAGVVWAVDPENRQVVVFRPGREPDLLIGRGAASAKPALPHFELQVEDLFAGLGE